MIKKLTQYIIGLAVFIIFSWFSASNVNAGNLGGTPTVTLNNITANVSTTHRLDFTTSLVGGNGYSGIPDGGTIEIIYPNGFDISQASLGNHSLGGNPILSISGQKITVTLFGSQIDVGNSLWLELNGVVNAGNIASDYYLQIETRYNGLLIDNGNTQQFSLASGSLIISGISNPLPAGSDSSVTVRALDNEGNLATGYRGTIHFTTGDNNPNVLLPNNYTFISSDNGQSTFDGETFGQIIRLITLGEQTVSVNDIITSQMIGIQNGILVTAGQLTSIDISPINSQTITAGQTIQFTVVSYDALGNLRSGDIFTWTNTNNTGLFTTTTAGNYQVKASIGSVDSNLVSVTVIHTVAVDHLSINPTDIHLANADQTQSYTVMAYDQFNNSWDVTTSAIFSTTDPKGTFVNNTYSAGKIGLWQIKAEFSGKSVITNITIDNAGVPNKIEFINAISELNTNNIYQFKVKVYDTDGNEISNPSITWSITQGLENSIIDSNGRFLANKIGIYKIKAQGENSSVILTFEVKDTASSNSSASSSSSSENSSTSSQTTSIPSDLPSTPSDSSSDNVATVKSSESNIVSTPASVSSEQVTNNQNLPETIVEVLDDSQGKIKSAEVVTTGAENDQNENKSRIVMILSIVITAGILGLAYWGYMIWTKPVEEKVKPKNRIVIPRKNIFKTKSKISKSDVATKEIPKIEDIEDKTRW